MKTILLILALHTSDSTVKKQRPFTAGLEGAAAVTVGNNIVSVNVGGPCLRLRLTPKWAVGVAAVPSLFIFNGKAEPKLGLTPRLDYGKWQLQTPGFYMAKTDKWAWTFGLGYKFM
ncbi:hypothetical protein [Chitinophaga sp. YIM B06452]|uniref:hypothetical protein n=1 Tax=Chitinophaga sp. YIM B06452 TaxID=3082158 RepID=UPI0031FEE298